MNEAIKKRIAEIDSRILELMIERSTLCIEELKKNNDPVVLYMERDSMLNDLLASYDGPLPLEAVRHMFTELFFSTAKMALPLSVAFLGPEGSFSSIAASMIFGESPTRNPRKTISDVFFAVEKDEALYGVVPIENSSEGAVTSTLDELMDTTLSIIGEQMVRISLNLLSVSGELSGIKKVYSHPQPLGQSKGWLRANLPKAELITVDSTTTASNFAREDSEAAAVASNAAADFYGLRVVAKNIEDMRHNYTRFFVIGKTGTKPTGNDKTSIVCTIKNKPSALFNLLKPFADLGIDMSRIESRPDKKKIWDYNFFIDFMGHRDDGNVIAALDKMREETVLLKILGSYPVARQ